MLQTLLLFNFRESNLDEEAANKLKAVYEAKLESAEGECYEFIANDVILTQ